VGAAAQSKKGKKDIPLKNDSYPPMSKVSREAYMKLPTLQLVHPVAPEPQPDVLDTLCIRNH
jgi:hypothetical protein